MFFYDSLAFIQVTLLLFITAGLGLRTVRLAAQEAPSLRPEAGAQFSSAGSIAG